MKHSFTTIERKLAQLSQPQKRVKDSPRSKRKVWKV